MGLGDDQCITYTITVGKTRENSGTDTVHHTNLKAANLRFVPRNAFSRVNTAIFEVTGGTVRLLHRAP
jgi:hypothetical protein